MSSTLLALYAAVRGCIYIGLLLLVGSEAVAMLIASTLADDTSLQTSIRHRVGRLGPPLVSTLIILFLARGALQVRSFLDPGDAITADVVSTVLASSAWGHAWLLQVAAALVLLVALDLKRRGTVTFHFAGAIAVSVTLWAQSGMGHAATNRWPAPLGRLLDTTHLLGAGLWIGTLAVLAALVVPLLRDEATLPSLARLVQAFSLYARTGVSLVVLSGVAAALVYAQSPSILIASTWGRLLLVKLGAMLGVLAVGWYNWRIVTPALNQTRATARRQLHVAIRLEILLAFVMLAITTLLVTSPLPGEG
jgi:putative copper export protein